MCTYIYYHSLRKKLVVVCRIKRVNIKGVFMQCAFPQILCTTPPSQDVTFGYFFFELGSKKCWGNILKFLVFFSFLLFCKKKNHKAIFLLFCFVFFSSK